MTQKIRKEVIKMNREELTDFIFNFWIDWGAFNYDEREDDEIKYEIYNNLKTEQGIQKELSYIENEIHNGWDEKSLEYTRLHELKNKINKYLEKR